MNFEKAGEVGRKRALLGEEIATHEPVVTTESASKTSQERLDDAWERLDELAGRLTGFGNAGAVVQISATTKDQHNVYVCLVANTNSTKYGDGRSIEVSWSVDGEAIGESDVIAESQLPPSEKPDETPDTMGRVEEGIAEAGKMLELPNVSFSVIGLHDSSLAAYRS